MDSSSEKRRARWDRRLVDTQVFSRMSTSDRQRTSAALPQIASLNPLVSLTAIPTLAPFVRDAGEANAAGAQEDITEFLRKEKVDVVVACDLTIAEMVGDVAARWERRTDRRPTLMRRPGLLDASSTPPGRMAFTAMSLLIWASNINLSTSELAASYSTRSHV